MSTSLTVGFDLDMTLIDSRPGIKAAFEVLAAETGAHIDADQVITRLGPPLEEEIARWFPAPEVAAVAKRYRELYPEYAIAPALPLPGARDSIAAVRRAGGRSVVVTAKHEPLGSLHLSHLGLEPDVVVGGLWAEGKAEALTSYGAAVYVGDHIGDVVGARKAGAVSVAVATGPCAPEALREAGADVVLPGLEDFPAWFAGWLMSSSPSGV